MVDHLPVGEGSVEVSIDAAGCWAGRVRKFSVDGMGLVEVNGGLPPLGPSIGPRKHPRLDVVGHR
jgi:hypothetical protein